MKISRACFPALCCCLAANVAFAQDRQRAAIKSDTDDLNYKQLAVLAVQDGGRLKPLDTFAREILIRITAHATYTDTKGRIWWPKDFLLAAVLKTHDWQNEPMVLVSLGKLKEQLGLPSRRRHFSFAQLTAMPELSRLANEAHELRESNKPFDRVQQEAMIVNERLVLLGSMMDGSALLIVPPRNDETGPWVAPSKFDRYYSEAAFAPVKNDWDAVAASYAKADAFQFSRSSKRLRDSLRALNPAIYPDFREMRQEYFYNHLEAFFRAIWLYATAFVLLLAAHLRGRGKALRNIGVGVALVGLGLHAVGILLRCLTASRPPVTNMYESIIWVSFAASLFGAIFFARYRTPICLLAALPVTLIALLLVHQMPIAMPASIDPSTPALYGNFWLTIHLLTITLSYAALALATGLGHILVWRYARNPRGTGSEPPVHFWLYRALQLGAALLLAGIAFGIWANHSRSGNWTWSSKEAWPLVALLCYITTLQGWLRGWWTQFGLGVASVICFFVVLMSWFDLGQGLYSHESGTNVEIYVAALMVFDLAFIAFAAWRHHGRRLSLSPRPAEVASEHVAV